MARMIEEGTYRAYYYKIGATMSGELIAYISIPEDILRKYRNKIAVMVGGLTWCKEGSGAFPDGMKVDQYHRVVGWSYRAFEFDRYHVRNDIKSVLNDIETMEFRDKNGLEQL